MSKTTYIYLNEYPNGYLYVGSHSWNGEGLDPNYQGSGLPSIHYHWKPSKITILEYVSKERKYIAEREWIEKYAEQYGIADCAIILDRNKNKYWWGKYKGHGRLMNLQANCLPPHVGTLASTDKVRKYGFTEKQKDKVRINIKIATEKAASKVKQNGLTEKQKEARRKNIKCTQTEASMKLKLKSHDYTKPHNKSGSRGSYACYLNDVEYSSIRAACRSIGHENWNCFIAKKLELYGFVEREGYRFELSY